MTPFPETIQTLLIDGPAGKLELLVEWPKQVSDTQAVGVVCHPHPLYEGTMHNKVVYTLAKVYQKLGMPTVRFNFRGVGASEGEYAEAVGESEDLLAVIDWALAGLPQAQLYLAGFSFGSYVATYGATQRPCQQLISVAPPVHHFPFDQLPHPACPWVVVQGDQDEVVSADQVFAWVEALVPKPQLITMSGAGHFFHGRLVDLSQQLLDSI